MDVRITESSETELSVEESAELRAAIHQMFEEMDRLNLCIETNQSDIDRLKVETRAMLAQLQAAC